MIAFSWFNIVPVFKAKFWLEIKIYDFFFLELYKLKIFMEKIYFNTFHCGYTLEPPRRSGSNEYPQSVLDPKEGN